LSRARVLTVTGLSMAGVGCPVPCLVGVLFRPTTGDSIEDRARYGHLLPWLTGAIMVSLAVAWIPLALASGDRRSRRRGLGGRTTE
jgi:hypothetical protein